MSTNIFKWSVVPAFLVIVCWALATFPHPAWAAGTPTATPTATASTTFPAATLTATATATRTTAATGTSTPLPTRTATATATNTNLPALTNTPTATKTNTPTATNAPTVTRTATATSTVQNTPTSTITPTSAASTTPTATPTTFSLFWWMPTPPWSTNPSVTDPWNQNAYNLKKSYSLPVFNSSNNTPVPPDLKGNNTPTVPGSTTPTVPAGPLSPPALTDPSPTQTNSQWSFPNIFPFGEPTRIALAPENAQPQATVDTQPGDLADTGTDSPSEANPTNPYYYARRLGTLTILASGILLLASGALSTAAIFFFIRIRLRR